MSRKEAHVSRMGLQPPESSSLASPGINLLPYPNAQQRDAQVRAMLSSLFFHFGSENLSSREASVMR